MLFRSQGRSPRELFQDLMGVIAGLEEPQAAQHLEGGRVMAERGCIDCHLPNARSAFPGSGRVPYRRSLTA